LERTKKGENKMNNDEVKSESQRVIAKILAEDNDEISLAELLSLHKNKKQDKTE
jgi:hypothetical protein